MPSGSAVSRRIRVTGKVEAAGFNPVATGDFVHDPADARVKPAFRPEQPIDELVLGHPKPR